MTKQFEQFVTGVMGVKLPPHLQELIKKMNAMPKGSTYQLICARPNAKRYLENAIAEIAAKVGK